MLCPTVKLGRWGPLVPRLIFGTEHIIHLSPEDGGGLLDRARRDYGLNHWDTAPAYASHPHVAAGLAQAGREKVVVTSKVPEKSAGQARERVRKILDELDTDYLDICFLHNVAEGSFEAHRGALEYLRSAKEDGLVRHVGISSHVPAILLEAAGEEGIEIVCGTLNLDGSRIEGGSLEDMRRALAACNDADKGVYAIKVLGVGDLVHRLEEAIEFALCQSFVDAVNIGMSNLQEVRQNAEIVARLMGESTE